MRKLKALFILCSLFFFEGLISCDRCPPGATSYYYNLTELAAINLDNSGKSAVETDSLQIKKEAFGIRARLKTQRLSANIKNKGSLLQSVVADYCPRFQSYTHNEISAIKIFSLHGFDEGDDGEAEVTEHFQVLNPHYNQPHKNYISVEMFVRDLYLRDEQFVDGNLFLFDDEWNFVIDMFLLDPPTNPGPHQFRIEVILSDESIFQATTQPMLLI